MKKTFFTGILIAVVFSSGAQVKCSINRAYAYFTVSIPGAQMVDEKEIPCHPFRRLNGSFMQKVREQISRW